jgi:glycosyltransferase involved in cell wall biosynthesis
MKSLSIVVPAFNEEESIALVVRDALAVGSAVADELEVLVCNDASRDRTGQILDGMALAEPRLRVLHHAQNGGIEASIRDLYREASREWVFLISADRQWPMDCLLTMVDCARDGGADLVVGVRSDKRAVYTAYRRVVSYGYEAIVRFLGSPVGDPGSIKLGRAEVLRVPVASRGVFADGERLIRAARAGYKVVGCPVPFHPRQTGKATGARTDVVARALLDAARVTSSLTFGWPPPA